MEEKIKWIIHKNIIDSADGLAFNIDLSAKEIVSNVVKFIEWLTDNHSFDGNIERAYQYWTENINHK